MSARVAVSSCSSASSSGNVAFDEYREETLRKLDEEQREFRDFLDRLRAAGVRWSAFIDTTT